MKKPVIELNEVSFAFDTDFILEQVNLIVGTGAADDAGVYRLNDETALIQTVDFFTPVVDDPYRFGQITAANVGLMDMWKQSFSDLSGGQRQRVLIARALAPSAELLFFDEPTANVDSFAEKQLYELLRKLNEKLTILIVSHDVGFVSKYVNSVVCVNRSVVIHPTSALDGKAIQAMYGQEIAMVRHDHRCSEKGHTCRNL
jgi:ABC-type phosphate/phosphonate transport system ATPase subunit